MMRGFWSDGKGGWGSELHSEVRGVQSLSGLGVGDVRNEDCVLVWLRVALGGKGGFNPCRDWELEDLSNEDWAGLRVALGGKVSSIPFGIGSDA